MAPLWESVLSKLARAGLTADPCEKFNVWFVMRGDDCLLNIYPNDGEQTAIARLSFYAHA